jgi:predicted secreted acid phosphatase
MLILISAIVLAIAPTAASAQTIGQQIPVPGPILTKLGHTPMVELRDGGGGLPYLGSSTSYNAGDWEGVLRAYATDDPKVSGPSVYEQQIAKVDAVAAKWLSHSGGRYKLARRGAHKRGVKLARVSHKRHGHKRGKRAIVFDVDETALSNYSAIDADNFTFGTNSKAEATNEIGKAIPPTLALYKLAQKKGIATFFITGRREDVRDHTAHNLQREGFSNYTQLVLKPLDFTGTTVDYKARARKAIEDQGYRIVASVGDQYSDLAGGHEAAAFKLPNPFYFLP